MKRFFAQLTLLCVILVLGSYMAPVSAQAAAYVNEGFEGYTTSLPTGWSVNTEDWYGEGGEWTLSSDASHGGLASIRFGVNFEASCASSWLISPQVAAQSDTRLSFYLRKTSDIPLQVLVSTDGGATYTEEITQQGDLDAACGWTKYSYSLAAYAGQNINVVFYAADWYNGGYIWIDDVKIGSPNTCATPISLSVTEVSQTSVRLNWTVDEEGDTSTTYRITLSDAAGNSVLNNQSITVSNKFSLYYDITNLTPNTSYTVFLQSDCSSAYHGTSDLSTTLTFETLCLAKQLPYSVDFNTESPTATKPGCWTNTPLYPTCGSINSSYAYGSTGKSLKLVSTALRDGYIVSPQFECGADSMQVDLWVYTTTYGTPIEFGVMSDAYDASTYEMLKSYNINAEAKWTNIRFTTAVSQQKGVRNLSVVIKLASGSAKTVYIDNVTISRIPSCLRPEQVNVDYIDSTFARLSWYEEVAVNNYEIEITNVADGTVSTVTATTNPAVVTGLTSNSLYQFRVRTICSASDNSEWSLQTNQYRTKCGSYALPLSENFNSVSSLPDCWDARLIYRGLGAASGYVSDYGWAINTNEIYSVDGNSIKSQSSIAGTRYLLTLPSVNIPAGQSYDVVFQMYRWYKPTVDANEYINVYVNSTPSLDGAVKIDSIFNSATKYPVEYDYEKYYRYRLTIPSTGVVYVMFEAVHDAFKDFYIDNIEINPTINCKLAVKNLRWKALTGDQKVQFNWFSRENETQWVVKYKFYDDSQNLLLQNTVVVNDSTYDLDYSSVASESSIYNVECQVAAYCGANDTSDYEPITCSFQTPCAARALPVIELFEGATFPSACWLPITDYRSLEPDAQWARTSRSYDFNTLYGSKSCGFPAALYRTVGYLNSPLVSLEAGVQYRVSYYMKKQYVYYDDYVVSGIYTYVSRNLCDTVNAQRLGFSSIDYSRFGGQPGFTKITHDFTVPASGNYHVIFAALQMDYMDIIIDDIVIEKVTSCSTPDHDAFEVRPGVNTATIIYNGGDATQIEYAVCAQYSGIDDIDPNNIVVATLDADNAFVITGLEADTHYAVYVRNHCSDGVSTWQTYPLDVTTMCTPYVVTGESPFIDDFESYDEGALVIDNCYQYENRSTNQYENDMKVYGGIGSYLGEPGTNVLPFSGEKQIAIGYGERHYASRLVRLHPGSTYEVALYVRTDDESAPEATLSFVKQVAGSTQFDTIMSAITLSQDAGFYNYTKVYQYFTVDVDTNYLIGFEVTSSWNVNYVAMDNFSIKELGCVPPTNIEITTVSSDSVEFAINNTNSPIEIRISSEYIGKGDTDPVPEFTDTVAAGTTVVSFRGLQPNTTYYYVMRSICNNGYSDWSTPAFFNTRCVAAEIPYTNDFENVANTRCWSLVGVEGSSLEYSNEQSHTGSGSMKVYSGTAVTPLFNVTTLSNAMITGYAYSDQEESSSFSIGLMIDVNDVSTFESLQTIVVPQGGQWVEFTVYLDTLLYDTDLSEWMAAPYIALATGVGNTFYYDDITVEVIPSCARPSDVIATVVDAHNVSLTWHNSRGVNSWEVSGYKVGNATALFTNVVTTNSMSVSNLDPITSYYFTVKSICSATDTSAVSYSNTVKTSCAPLALPYFSGDFMTEPDCWTADNNFRFSVNYGDAGYHSYYIDLAEIQPTDTAILTTPEFVLTGNRGVVFSVNGFLAVETADLPLYYTLDGGQTYTRFPQSVFTLPDEEGAYDQRMSHEFILPNVGPGTIQFAFIGTYSPTYWAEIHVSGFDIEELESCGRPQDVTFEFQNNSVVAHIMDTIADHNQWEYVLGIGDFDPNTKTPTVVSNVFTIDNIENARVYNIYVRTVCDSEHSNWYKPYVFHSPCGPVSMPYNIDFETLNSNVDILSECYSYDTDNTDNSYLIGGSPNPLWYPYYPYVSLNTTSDMYNSREGSKCVSMYSSLSNALYFVGPEINVPLNSLDVEFNYVNYSEQSTSNANIVFGIMMKGDKESFTPLYVCPLKSGSIDANKVRVNLNEVLPAGDYTGYTIAFKYGPAPANDICAAVDNINIIQKEKCSEGAKLEWTDATDNSIRLATSYYADSIQVAYGITGTNVENCTKFYTTSNNITIDNLTSGTGYDVYVRNVCNNVAGEWSRRYYASTNCGAITIARGSEWVENFDAPAVGDAFRFPACVSRMQVSEVGGVETPLVADTANITAPAALAMNNQNMIILPQFDKNPSAYQISFYVKGNGSFELGTVTGNDVNTFTTLESLNATVNYTRRYFDLQNYLASGNRIAIRSLADSKIIIDSIAVYYSPSCFAPKFLETRNIRDVSATVAFTMSSLTSSYEYYVKSNTDSVTYQGTGFVEEINLTGLQANTQYTFGIRSYCENSTTPTEWATIPFTTSRLTLRLPATLDFEDASQENYVVFGNVEGDNYFVCGNATGAYKGTKALYVTDGINGYNYAQVNSGCYVAIPILVQPGALSISYEIKTVGEYEYDFARVFLSPSLTEYDRNQIRSSSLPAGCIAIDGGQQLYNISDWTLKTAKVSFTEERTMYLYVYWNNDYMDCYQPPVAIDNITFFIPECEETIRTGLAKVTHNSAFIDVTLPSTLKDSIYYELFENGIVAESDTIQVVNGRFFIDGLNSETDYSVVVYGMCENGFTIGSSTIFTTLCNPVAVNQTTPYFVGFENTGYDMEIADLFPCWVVDVNSRYFVPQTLYSEAESDGLLPYEGTQAMLLRSYTYDTYTLSNTYSMESGSYKFSVRAMSSNASNGTIMLFTRPINQVEWDTVVVETLGNAYKEYSVFFNVEEGNTDVYEIAYKIVMSEYLYVVVDNVSLKYIQVMPPVLSVDNILSNGARLNWTSTTDTTHISLYEDIYQLVDTTIVGGIKTFNFTGLAAGTTYKVAAYAVKGNGTQSDEAELYFTTDCEILSNYSEDFESYSEGEEPLCWYYDNSEEDEYALQWQAGTVGNRNALVVDASYLNSGVVSVIRTPYFYIDQDKPVSFDYFNNVPNSSNPDSLVVSILKNGSVVEELLVATYRTTNNQWCSFTQNLTNYVGDTIQLQFLHRTTGYGSTCQVAIDNFSLACTVVGATYNEHTCPNMPYVGHGFNIKPIELTIGSTTTFSRKITNTGVGCDTVITLNVFVPLNNTIEVYDTICEGDTYVSEVFTTGLTRSGRYTVTSKSSFGCDSNVVLFLTVVPVNNYKTVNICEGSSYTFAGQTLTQSGVYTDTAVSRHGCDSITILTLNVAPRYYEENYLMCEGASYVWQEQTIFTAGRYEVTYQNAYGCDSIRVLNVTVIPTNVSTTVELCQGQSYQFGNQTITEAGTYTGRFANSLNCDSIVTLTVTIKPAPVGVFEDYACEGYGYFSNGFSIDNVTKDTVVERTVRNLDGCDSIVRVNVTFIPTKYSTIEETINEGDSYTFAGNTYTQAGTYTGRFFTDLGCDSVVTLILTVTTPVDNAYALPIVVAPNPVYGGQSTFVSREWTVAEQNGMRVEVLNAVGQVVDVFTPTAFPIEVGGIYVSGVYYIRITTGTGDIYLGRLVVR